MLAVEGCRVVMAARRDVALESAAAMIRNLLRNTAV
jgi:hypothetical protein